MVRYKNVWPHLLDTILNVLAQAIVVCGLLALGLILALAVGGLDVCAAIRETRPQHHGRAQNGGILEQVRDQPGIAITNDQPGSAIYRQPILN